MLLRSFFLLICITVTFSEVPCSSKKVFTSVDNSNTKMNLQDQFLVVNTVINATLKSDHQPNTHTNIFDALNPTYSTTKVWTVIQLPAKYKIAYDEKIYITACRCNNCTEYRIFNSSHNKHNKDVTVN